MTSVNKFRKTRNSYCENALKQGSGRLKRIFFYDASQRKHNKKVDDKQEGGGDE